ncbi:Hypothetical protein, putative [Bodo saltans]|uniref:Transmembrane protein n=1 Tax=Bodo saltans TaxID=75058 RepID=A0A0S4KKS6_BODSA|nr:Hypothetical protein, putative [Bodo saltans]|eukprot:CUI15059.1 Hypothetical protein, putative [Bodo saltans]
MRNKNLTTKTKPRLCAMIRAHITTTMKRFGEAVELCGPVLMMPFLLFPLLLLQLPLLSQNCMVDPHHVSFFLVLLLFSKPKREPSSN